MDGICFAGPGGHAALPVALLHRPGSDVFDRNARREASNINHLHSICSAFDNAFGAPLLNGGNGYVMQFWDEGLDSERAGIANANSLSRPVFVMAVILQLPPCFAQSKPTSRLG